MSDLNTELDRLLETLETAPAPTAAPPRAPDAIDRVLASAPRVAHARSLRNDEIVQRFRAEMESGLMRVDTVRQLLGLIRMALEAPQP